MIIDTSAVIAILFEEADFRRYAEALANAGTAHMSAATYVEIGTVIDRRRDPRLSRRVDDLIVGADVLIKSVTEGQARIAREAYRDFGRGSGHPARLNFGDCFAYALAKDLGEPLLFKGDDFAQTDVASAL